MTGPCGTSKSVCLRLTRWGLRATGWQTGVALDASSSMMDWYGKTLTAAVPAEVQAEYRGKGWVRDAVQGGRPIATFTRPAYDDAVRRGFVAFTPNIVQPLVRDFVAYLAGRLDADGGTTVIYWAGGPTGAECEVVGDFTATECQHLTITGPARMSFGTGTRLTPAVRYFVERFAAAPRGLYVFLTDGRLDDLDDLTTYTTELARLVATGRRNPVKCVLVGVGTAADEPQMAQLDDLDTGTDVDIWDYKLAADLRGVHEIMAELADESQIVAPTATVYDATGAVAAHFPAGLPAKAAFTLPAASRYFELEANGQLVRQVLG